MLESYERAVRDHGWHPWFASGRTNVLSTGASASAAFESAISSSTLTTASIIRRASSLMRRISVLFSLHKIRMHQRYRFKTGTSIFDDLISRRSSVSVVPRSTASDITASLLILQESKLLHYTAFSCTIELIRCFFSIASSRLNRQIISWRVWSSQTIFNTWNYYRHLNFQIF